MAYRVGEAHPRAVLTDDEIDRMLEDRGPDNAPKMSYRQLAARYGVSKSCVRDIISGSRRGRIAAQREIVKLEIAVSLPTRAKIMRRGGAQWLERIVAQAFRECAKELEEGK
jgi:hypothetical protein